MIKEFWLITNYSCNNRCQWCYTQPRNYNPTIMPVFYAKEVMEEMKRIGAKKCTLIGGEPTLYPHFFSLVQYGRRLNLFMKVVTNGRLLSDLGFVKKLKKSGVSLVAISIHGANLRTQNLITRTESYHETVTSIKNCLKEKINFLTLTTLNKLNQNEIYKIGKSLSQLGVKSIVFNLACPSVGEVVSAKSVLPPDKLAQIIQDNYFKFKKKGIKVGFYATIPLCLYNRKLLTKMIEENYLIPLAQGGCNVYSASGLVFDPWGNIIPCCKQTKTILINTKDENDRFIYKDRFEEVWKRIRKNFGKRAWQYPSKKCTFCGYRKNCIGGCPLFWGCFNPFDYVKGFDLLDNTT